MDAWLGDLDTFKDAHREKWETILKLAKSSLTSRKNDDWDQIIDCRERSHQGIESSLYGPVHEGNEATQKGQVHESNAAALTGQVHEGNEATLSGQVHEGNEATRKGPVHEGNEATQKGPVHEGNETVYEESAAGGHTEGEHPKTHQRFGLANTSLINRSPNVGRLKTLVRGAERSSVHRHRDNSGAQRKTVLVRCSFVCLLVVTAVVLVDDFIDYAEVSTAELSYQVFRHGRKMMHAMNLLHNNSSLIENCMVQNPLFSLGWVCRDCLRAQNVTHLKIGREIVLTDSQTDPSPQAVETTFAEVTLSKLQESIAVNYQPLDSSLRGVMISNVLAIQHINDLADGSNIDQLTSQEDASIEWTPDNQRSKEMLRNLFPITPYISSNGFTAQNMTLIISNKKAVVVKYSKEKTIALYTQGKGSTGIILFPAFDCKKKCKELRFDLKPGQIVSFDASAWNIEISNIKKQTDVSIGLLETFSNSQQ